MISVLGWELEAARTALEEAGCDVEAHETRSRKGVNGDEARVVRQRVEGGRAELIWAVFKTECGCGG